MSGAINADADWPGRDGKIQRVALSESHEGDCIHEVVGMQSLRTQMRMDVGAIQRVRVMELRF
eukprot:COSAG01_NODE_77_length_28297_cov_104.096230_3_plen_63_part_00